MQPADQIPLHGWDQRNVGCWLGVLTRRLANTPRQNSKDHCQQRRSQDHNGTPLRIIRAVDAAPRLGGRWSRCNCRPRAASRTEFVPEQLVPRPPKLEGSPEVQARTAAVGRRPKKSPRLAAKLAHPDITRERLVSARTRMTRSEEPKS